jgi:hypothetical protein
LFDTCRNSYNNSAEVLASNNVTLTVSQRRRINDFTAKLVANTK